MKHNARSPRPFGDARLSEAGAATESFMILVPLAVALIIALVFTGGPRQLIALADEVLRNVGQSVYEWARWVLG